MTSVVDKGASKQAATGASDEAAIVVRPIDRRLGPTVVRIARKIARLWPSILLFTIVLGSWEAYVRIKHIALIYVPAPSVIYQEVAGRLGFYWSNTLVTLQEAGLGLLFGSIVAGIAAALMAESSIADRAFLPFFVVVKVVPSVALVPLFVIAMGFGLGPKVVVAALTVYYTVFINAVTGFKSVDEGALEVMRSVNATRREIFLRLRVPNSLPYLFAAAKIGFPLAVLGAMFGELYTSQEGLGNIIVKATSRFNMSTMWGAIAVIALIGVILVGGLGIAERRMLKWHSSQREL